MSIETLIIYHSVMPDTIFPYKINICLRYLSIPVKVPAIIDESISQIIVRLVKESTNKPFQFKGMKTFHKVTGKVAELAIIAVAKYSLALKRLLIMLKFIKDVIILRIKFIILCNFCQM